jgi:hypothetical protein
MRHTGCYCFKEAWDDPSLFGSVQVDDRPSFIQLRRHQRSLLERSCLDVLSFKRKRPFSLRRLQFDFRLHLPDVDQFASYEAVSAFLSLGMHIDHGIIFVHHHRHFITDFWDLVVMPR